MGSSKPSRWRLNRTLTTILWILVSLTIWAGIHWYIRRLSMRKAEEGLISMCEERASMLQDRFAVSVNHVHALAILISTLQYQKNPPALDQDTFADYTARTAFERPLLSGVAYAQRVVHAQREIFESQQGWVIQTMKRDPSPVKDEYAPVIYSQETVSYIEALDMMSGQEDRENILRARATGKAVLTSPFRLLKSNHLGVVLTFPVFSTDLLPGASQEERVEATAGYLGGAFDVESLVENLLSQLAGNPEIIVKVYDVTNESQPLIMYGPDLPDGFPVPSHISTLDFGDPFRKHQMICRYSKKPSVPLSAITTPSGVFVICMLVGYIVYAAWNRYDNVKEDCRKMEELKKQAEAADVAKSQFLATVSHEIRTPMNGVLGMLDMLLDTTLNSTQKDFAQTAQVCGKALISLINEVLDRAKIEAGKLELESVPFDLRSILDDVISLFSSKSREKGIELAVYVSDRVPEMLLGDPGRFRQIITNLVGNSIKFTERGHIFVQVHLSDHSTNPFLDPKPITQNDETTPNPNPSPLITDHDTLSGQPAADTRNTWDNFKQHISLSTPNGSSTPPNGSNGSDQVTLVVTVEDTGTGIPTHAQSRVFTPFMQADSSTSRNYGGTGIGLSISKCLVELMNGQIGFVSKPDIGSTFTFTAVLEKEGGEGSRGILDILPGGFRGFRAVLVDKRKVRAVVTKYHLRRLGVWVETVGSVDEGIGALSAKNGFLTLGSKRQPCLFLVESDSWESKTDSYLHEQISERTRNGSIPDPPRIFLLATSESDKTKISGFSEKNLIMKPLKASSLAACLQLALGVDSQNSKNEGGERKIDGAVSLRGLLAGRNILVVDDNKVNLRVAAGTLKKYGAKVECVESGKDALALLQVPHKFDACFMDVQMPEMDGFEATRQIRLMEKKANEKIKNGENERKNEKEWHLPILAMTADVIQATHEKCIKCGMDGYVSKPFEEKQLYQAVAQFLVPADS
ncbi:hypothetical protein LUZ60_006244 [Juncus effusus]|nr:hypothetical protein LUZ60_006244 [Juncus effusus]